MITFKRYFITIAMVAALQTAWAQNTGLFREQTETDYSDFEITHAYFTPNGTATSSSGGYDMTGYIPVKGGDVIVFSGDRSPGIPFMMGYAANDGSGATILLGDFDGSNWNNLQVTEEEVTIPAGLAYVRCSARNTSLPNWASRNMSVIKRSPSNVPPIVRVLAMGNSFTIDCMESSLFAVARDAGIHLVLGNACWGGFSFEEHYQALVEDSPSYEYHKCDNGEFTVNWGQCTRLSSIFADEPWDVVVFQQASHFAGFYDTYEPSLTNLINELKKLFPDAKCGLHMIWAYSQDSKNPKFVNYNKDQMFMFNSIVDATRKTMEAHPELEFLIPTGTAIQNLRTSFVGDNLNRDGSHLTLDLGRATAAYSWYAVLFGEEMTRQNTYTPYNLNEFSTTMVKNTVLAAIHNPYSITPQNYPDYTGDNTIVPGDINFNFSHWGTETDGWNDVTLNDEFAGGYKDVMGKETGIILQSSNHFWSANTAGESKTDTPLGMPSDVSQTALVGYSEGELEGGEILPAPSLQFQHLNKTLTYDFTFFASRAGITDNRETQFILSGKDTLSATLNASCNKAGTVTISDMSPDEDGCITLTIQAGPNNNNSNKFYYLNALRISAHGMDFALKGEERPVAGDSLSVTADGDLSRYTFRWTKGDVLGTFDDTALSSTKDYVIKESDYEHWLRVVVCNNMGDTVFTKDIWISKLPVLYIDTEGGLPITSKKDYLTANLRIQGNAEFEQQYMGKTEIRGRGASSWSTYPQKPYKLKLDKKTKLFGFGKSKHWVLLSNFNDKSCLRNYTASRLAKQLNVLGMNMTWVDVVINGEVNGCYMLSQQIRADKNSVDIFDWEGEAEDVADALFFAVKDAEALEEEEKAQLETAMKQNLAWITDGLVSFKNKTYNLADYGLKKEYDISNGYLFEFAHKSNLTTIFTTPGNLRFELTEPEYLKTNAEMMTYVTDLWNDFEAEYSQAPTEEGKPFDKYADMESMVGVWLTDEIMGQDDYANSHYSYITEDKKIHFGPVWDFDHGGGSWSVTQYTTIFYTLYGTLNFKYYKKWFPDPELCLMAFDAYWNVARPFIMDYISEGGEMDTKYAHFADAGITNDIIWGGYPNNIKPSAEPLTTAEDVEILRTFLQGHINWLDKQFQTPKTLVESMNKYCTYPCSPDLIDGIASPHPSLERKGFNKIIKDKHLYIIRDGETYSVDGKRTK